MHLIDANEVDQQIRTHYMLWAVRNVEEMHPTIDSELIWNKKGFIIYIYIEREREREIQRLWIGVICASVIVKLLTISSFIVWLL